MVQFRSISGAYIYSNLSVYHYSTTKTNTKTKTVMMSLSLKILSHVDIAVIIIAGTFLMIMIHISDMRSCTIYSVDSFTTTTPIHHHHSHHYSEIVTPSTTTTRLQLYYQCQRHRQHINAFHTLNLLDNGNNAFSTTMKGNNSCHHRHCHCRTWNHQNFSQHR